MDATEAICLFPTETQSQILEDYVQSLRQKSGVESILWMYLRNVTWLNNVASLNKLAKAWKMRKPPGTLGLKEVGPGKIWVKNVWTQNTCILAFLHTFILFKVFG